MAKICPNKNTKLYKRLSRQLSKDNVYRVWGAITTPEFDAWYGNRRRDSDGMPIIDNFFEIQNDKLVKGTLLENAIKLESKEEVERLFSSLEARGISKQHGSYYVSKNNREAGVKFLKKLVKHYPNLIVIKKSRPTTQELGVVDQSIPETYRIVINEAALGANVDSYSPKRTRKIGNSVARKSRKSRKVGANIKKDTATGPQFIINRIKEYGESINNKLQDELKKARETKDYSKVEKLKKQYDGVQRAIVELQDKNFKESIIRVANNSLKYVENIVNKENVTAEDLVEAHRIIALYENLGSRDPRKNMSILTENDFKKIEVVKTDPETGKQTIVEDLLDTTKKIIDISKEAQMLHESLDVLTRKLITQEYNERFDSEVDEETLFENITDINAFSQKMRGGASVNNAMLTLLTTISMDATAKSTQETLADKQKLNEVINKAKGSKLYGRLQDKLFTDFFWQKNKKGEKTGGRLDEWSHAYYQLRGKLLGTIYGNKNAGMVKKSKKEFYKNHTFVGYFLDEDGNVDEKAKQEQIDKLTKEFGTIKALKEVTDAETVFKDYHEMKEAAFFDIESQEISEADKDFQKEMWLYRHDPAQIEKDFKEGGIKRNEWNYIVRPSLSSVRFIPKMNIDGKNTEFYEEDYLELFKKGNEGALEYYQYFSEKLRELLSYYPQTYKDVKGIHEGFIPVLHKGFRDELMDSGASYLVKGLKKAAIEAVSIKTQSESLEHFDPNTGEMIYSPNIKMLSPQYVYKDGTRTVATDHVITDINEIMSQFIGVTNDYKHKARVEATHKMVMSGFDLLKGVKTTQTGIDRVNTSGDSEADVLNNVKRMARFENEVFYDKHVSNREEAGKKKILNKEEKELKAQLEEEITKRKDELKNNKDLTKDQEESILNEIHAMNRTKEDLGRNLSHTKAIKGWLRWFQLVTLGWSLQSPTMEILWGRLTVLNHAAGGADFNKKQANAAFRIALQSLAPGNNSDTAQKFKALVEKLDIVGEVAEVEKKKLNHSARQDKWTLQKTVAPYELMRKADMLSKGSVMVAKLMNTNLKGEPLAEGEVSLWDAFDKNGELKEQYRTDENIENWEFDKKFENTNKLIKMGQIIDHINERLHGPYNPKNPMELNSSAYGKSVLQFRRWLVEGVATRFEKKDFNDLLGREVKGKYITYGTMFSELGAPKTLSIMMKAVAGHLSFSPISNEQLIEAGMDISEDSELSAVDLENVRKNASGLIWAMSVLMFGLIARAMVDDEDKKKLTVANFLLNQGGRLQQDLWFYTDPDTATDVTKNFIPSVRLIGKIKDWGENVIKTTIDIDPEYDPRYQSGTFKDESKALIKTFEIMPVGAAVIQTLRTAGSIRE